LLNFNYWKISGLEGCRWQITMAKLFDQGRSRLEN